MYDIIVHTYVENVDVSARQLYFEKKTTLKLKYISLERKSIEGCDMIAETLKC